MFSLRKLLHPAQVSKFLTVGLLSGPVNYGIFAGLVVIAHVHYLFAAIAGFVSAVVFSFILNRSWTFKSRDKKITRQLLMYSAVYGVSLLFFTVVLQVLVELFSIHPLIAQIVATGLAAILNFFGLSRFAFRNRP